MRSPRLRVLSRAGSYRLLHDEEPTRPTMQTCTPSCSTAPKRRRKVGREQLPRFPLLGCGSFSCSGTRARCGRLRVDRRARRVVTGSRCWYRRGWCGGGSVGRGRFGLDGLVRVAEVLRRRDDVADALLLRAGKSRRAPRMRQQCVRRSRAGFEKRRERGSARGP